MVDQLLDSIVQKICDFLPAAEAGEFSVVEKRLRTLTLPRLEECFREFLRRSCRDYYESTGVDPEVAFGPISEVEFSASSF